MAKDGGWDSRAAGTVKKYGMQKSKENFTYIIYNIYIIYYIGKWFFMGGMA